MKRPLVLFVLLLLGTSTMFAVPACPYPFTVYLPDGDSLVLVNRGDEFGHWLETTDGYIVMKDIDGFYKYAEIKEGKITPSSVSVKPGMAPSHLVGSQQVAVRQSLNEKRRETIRLRNAVTEKYNAYDSVTLQSLQQKPDLIAKSKSESMGTTGVKKILVILLNFRDIQFSTPNANEAFDDLMNLPGYTGVDGTAYGSVRDFYYENSYGQLTLQATVVGPVSIDHSSWYYGANEDGSDVKRRKMAYHAICAVPSSVDWSEFDNDGDGYVDCVHIVFAGHGEEEGNGKVYPDAIWSHRWSITPILRDGVWVKDYIATPELYGDGMANIGTICHELGHILGAPDFYDLKKDDDCNWKGTGHWDLMCNGGWNLSGRCPAHHNPYTKTQIFGWANVQELSGTDRLYTLKPASSDKNSFYKVSTATPGEYYLLENRQKEKFDSGLPYHGLLAYHVHADIMSDRYNINTGHPQKLYPVNGNSDLPLPTSDPASYGNSEDGMPFPSMYQNTCFTSTSFPRLQSWAGEIVRNKDIYFIRENNGNVQFVLNPIISGPSSICREETYTIDGLPDGAEVQWIATVPRRLPHEDPIFAIPLLVKEGQGTSTVTFEQGHYNGSIIIGNTKPYVGEAVISAKITYGSASVTLTKDVYVQTTERPEITLSLYPKPDIDVDSSFITHPGIGGGSIANPPLSNMASYEFSCANLEGHEDFQWTFVASNGTQVKDGRSVIVNHPAKGTLVVTLRHKDGCPDAAIATETYTVMGLRLLATNPASGSAEMQVVWDATPEGGTGAMSLSAVPTIPYEGEYEIELWDLLRGRLMVVEGEGGYTQFPLCGIPSGNYVLRLVIDGQQMDSLPLTVR